MIFPENRFPPPIKSRTGFFGIMRQAGVARGTTVRHNSEVEVKTRLTIGDSGFLWATADCDGLRVKPMKWGFLILSACMTYAAVASRMCAQCVHGACTIRSCVARRGDTQCGL